jgi:hypothetical protein
MIESNGSGELDNIPPGKDQEAVCERRGPIMKIDEVELQCS